MIITLLWYQRRCQSVLSLNSAKMLQPILETLNKQNIILASGSPRRKEIMTALLMFCFRNGDHKRLMAGEGPGGRGSF